ncbi:hypothetical protein A6A03_15670 [Chloroflexus islandicus]|uniref:Uncharacterized protein n=1 Tax=Chloroflexus islandicus TaxID=1707952 RepID=A0A178M9E2_9CHLR|nr:hypothetical protein [Chloroflexus islandicus]OAN45153.1 hypothetical protein A6A03_15670 [Chloroflexus islandicus]
MTELDAGTPLLFALGITVDWYTVVRVVIEIIRFVREQWGQQSAPQPPSSFVICMQLEKTIARRGAHNIVGLAVIVPARPIVRSRRGAMLDRDVGTSFLLSFGTTAGRPTVVRLVFEGACFVREQWGHRPNSTPTIVIILTQQDKTIAGRRSHNQGAKSKRRKSRRRRRFRP